MTLKYESEILFDLMKRDGDDTPSDVLPYESELKEKYLQQVEGAYPKLQDYRPEWLNYNLNAHIPADFPVESVSNVTNATFENVVPYTYGSAILKGHTLVNLYPVQRIDKVVEENKLTYLTSQQSLKIPISNGKKAIFTFNISTPFTSTFTGFCQTLPNWNRVNFSITNGKNFIIFDTTNNNDDIISFDFYIEDAIVGNYTITDMMVIEYQDGMENWDIPYFESMQSVQMPVLTTTGKNLFDKSTVKYNTTIQTYADGQEVTDNNYMVSDFIEVKPNTTYTSNYMGVILYYDENRKFIGALDDGVLPQNLTTPNNCKYIRIRCWERYNTIEKQREIVELEQLEENSVVTTYEPYKTNILTVNEEVELRGIGDVKDELNLLTGEVTQRIRKIVLDGSQNMDADGRGIYIQVDDMKKVEDYRTIITCDKLPVFYYHWDLPNVENGITGYHDEENKYPSQNWLYIKINNSIDVDEVRQILTQNPITIQYELSVESIKTVDLTVTDQDGYTTSIFRPIEGTMHVSTSSQTLPPLLDMSVPVEATTQNLMSFANIVEEE